MKFRGQWLHSPVPAVVTRKARRDDVLARVAAAVLARDQVLGSALEQSRLSNADAVGLCERRGIASTHFDVTIETATVLGRTGLRPITGNGIEHGGFR
jgi:hypothetical protein